MVESDVSFVSGYVVRFPLFKLKIINNKIKTIVKWMHLKKQAD